MFVGAIVGGHLVDAGLVDLLFCFTEQRSGNTRPSIGRQHVEIEETGAVTIQINDKQAGGLFPKGSAPDAQIGIVGATQKVTAQPRAGQLNKGPNRCWIE